MSIVFVVQSMGYNNNLLYWEAILQELYAYEKKIKVYSRDTNALVKNTNIAVKKNFPIGRFSAILKIPSLFRLLRHEKETKLIVSEFNAITLSVVIVCLFLSRLKLVLLIENDPKYLLYYKNNRPGRLVSYVKLLYRRFIASNVDIVVTNTVGAQEYALNELRVPNDKVINKMYLTSSLVNLNERFYCAGGEKVTFISVGRMDYRKGFDLLVLAVACLDKVVKKKCKFIIVGDGLSRKEIEMMINENKLVDTFHLTGSQSYEQIKNWYLSADVAIITTRADYRSLVGFEAISCGLPIIASVHDGASNEIVVEGCNGFIIDPSDITTLAEKITWFANNSTRIEEFGRYSLRRAKLFTPAIAAKNLYEAVMSRPDE
ncbi:MAG: glycosyltransferase family 4 protein [Nitrosomonas sp.]|nr:glycosyltransferase family 4 protein [Nitrosomonas sp.]